MPQENTIHKIEFAVPQYVLYENEAVFKAGVIIKDIEE